MKNIGNLFVRLFVISLLTFRHFSIIVSLFGAGAAPFIPAPAPAPAPSKPFRRLRLRLRLRIPGCNDCFSESHRAEAAVSDDFDKIAPCEMPKMFLTGVSHCPVPPAPAAVPPRSKSYSMRRPHTRRACGRRCGSVEGEAGTGDVRLTVGHRRPGLLLLLAQGRRQRGGGGGQQRTGAWLRQKRKSYRHTARTAHRQTRAQSAPACTAHVLGQATDSTGAHSPRVRPGHRQHRRAQPTC